MGLALPFSLPPPLHLIPSHLLFPLFLPFHLSRIFLSSFFFLSTKRANFIKSESWINLYDHMKKFCNNLPVINIQGHEVDTRSQEKGGKYKLVNIPIRSFGWIVFFFLSTKKKEFCSIPKLIPPLKSFNKIALLLLPFLCISHKLYLTECRKREKKKRKNFVQELCERGDKKEFAWSLKIMGPPKQIALHLPKWLGLSTQTHTQDGSRRGWLRDAFQSDAGSSWFYLHLMISPLSVYCHFATSLLTVCGFFSAIFHFM